MTALLGTYRPRDTVLHRTPTWAKVGLLVLFAATTVAFHEPLTSLALLVAGLLFLISVEPPAKATAKGLVAITVIALLTGAIHVYNGDVDRAMTTSANLIAIAAVALAITGSTPMERMMSLMARMLQPLRRMIPPEIMGLMFALMLRAIPEIARLLHESRIAAKARGLERRPTAILVPTATRTVGFALDLGQALQARGIADEAPGRAS